MGVVVVVGQVYKKNTYIAILSVSHAVICHWKTDFKWIITNNMNDIQRFLKIFLLTLGIELHISIHFIAPTCSVLPVHYRPSIK